MGADHQRRRDLAVRLASGQVDEKFPLALGQGPGGPGLAGEGVETVDVGLRTESDEHRACVAELQVGGGAISERGTGEADDDARPRPAQGSCRARHAPTADRRPSSAAAGSPSATRTAPVAYAAIASRTDDRDAEAIPDSSSAAARARLRLRPREGSPTAALSSAGRSLAARPPERAAIDAAAGAARPRARSRKGNPRHGIAPQPAGVAVGDTSLREVTDEATKLAPAGDRARPSAGCGGSASRRNAASAEATATTSSLPGDLLQL